MPDAVGVPLMVIVFDPQVADTPAGKPSVPELPPEIPVAPVVAIVILVKAVLIHSVGVDDGVPAVLTGITTSIAPMVGGLLRKSRVPL